MKKGITISVLIIIISAAIVGLSFNIPIQTDSGWDTDYSSGGSDWSSSDSWSSSDHSWNDSDSWSSSDYSWNDSDGYSSSYSSSSTSSVIGFIVLLCLFGSFTLIVIGSMLSSIIREKKKLNNNVERRVIVNPEMSEQKIVEMINKLLPGYSKNTLIDLLYDNLINVQEAWMNFDYDGLKKLCTNQLFESYKSDLEVLKLKNGKNIMNNFKLISSRIIKVLDESDKIVVVVNMYVSFYDYVIDVNSNKVIRGNKYKKVNNNYLLKYVKKKSVLDVCPSCGARLNGEDCSSCGTHIDNNNDLFVLSEKKRI